MGFSPPPLGHRITARPGVRHEAVGRGIGAAMKLHQRLWCLEHGITRMSWTFDPLIARNAYFNIGARLGALPSEYHPDFYGQMRDGVNAGHASDRVFVEWDLTAASPCPQKRAHPQRRAHPGTQTHPADRDSSSKHAHPTGPRPAKQLRIRTGRRRMTPSRPCGSMPTAARSSSTCRARRHWSPSRCPATWRRCAAQTRSSPPSGGKPCAGRSSSCSTTGGRSPASAAAAPTCSPTPRGGRSAALQPQPPPAAALQPSRISPPAQ